MAENISQFKAGKALLSLLQQHGVKDHGIQQITAVVAQLLDEARGVLLWPPMGLITRIT